MSSATSSTRTPSMLTALSAFLTYQRRRRGADFYIRHDHTCKSPPAMPHQAETLLSKWVLKATTISLCRPSTGSKMASSTGHPKHSHEKSLTAGRQHMKRESSLSRSWADVDEALNNTAQHSLLMLGVFLRLLPSCSAHSTYLWSFPSPGFLLLYQSPPFILP